MYECFSFDCEIDDVPQIVVGLGKIGNIGVSLKPFGERCVAFTLIIFFSKDLQIGEAIADVFKRFFSLF